jgi:hypothetical protein
VGFTQPQKLWIRAYLKGFFLKIEIGKIHGRSFRFRLNQMPICNFNLSIPERWNAVRVAYDSKTSSTPLRSTLA